MMADSPGQAGLSAGYQRNPAAPRYWLYDGLHIHADVETHRFVTGFAREHFLPHTRILDVAAGNGALTRQLLDIGMDVSCTSWNGKAQVPVPTYKLDLDLPFSSADVGNSRYSMICAIEIIEHLENPSSFLRHLRGVVAEDGWVMLSTPNVESAQARFEWLVRGCPYIFDGEEIHRNRHISMMWRQGLEFLMKQAGFEVVEKHLVGGFRFNSIFQAVIRRPILGLMQYFLRGDLKGTTRLYVMRPSSTIRRGGPDQFN